MQQGCLVVAARYNQLTLFLFKDLTLHVLLTVIIVNYNVRYFLEQCLKSVQTASTYASARMPGFSTEVWVVDNNSTDGSVQMVRDKFPDIHLIANSDNPGFATANNQAIRQCGGDYILLLNPDTLVQEDTFSTCIDFFQDHPDCGGLSVKMINGEGEFLKESKRGFPSPATSFFKISGLIRLFPHNKKVGAYYMGHLDDDTVNEVDVLPGAFLMISRQALDKTGLLDESYFMYGEDIDFSWRIKLAGYKNYYLPSTRILHYKGESTRKSSMNYVYTFYNAMAIFAKRYFAGGNMKLYTMLIQCAIWLRASLDFLKRIISHLAVPFLDFVISFAGFLAIKYFWSTYWAENVNYYPSFYTWGVLPVYVLILLIASWLAGGYDKPIRVGRIINGMSVGAICLLLFYSLLNEEMRFSRAIVLLGSLWSILACVTTRIILSMVKVDGYSLNPDNRKRYLFIGSEEEGIRLNSLFDTLGIVPKQVKSVTPEDTSLKNTNYGVDVVVFSGRDIKVKDILDITISQSRNINTFRILPDSMDVLIGSSYTSSAEDLYTPDFGIINNATNRRSKRLFDILAALLMIVLSPILFWIQKRKRRYLADCLSVLAGRKSWVGYSLAPNQISLLDISLPNIRQGVFRTRDRMPQVKNPDCERLDVSYANDYHVSTDLSILLINLRRI